MAYVSVTCCEIPDTSCLVLRAVTLEAPRIEIQIRPDGTMRTHWGGLSGGTEGDLSYFLATVRQVLVTARLAQNCLAAGKSPEEIASAFHETPIPESD